MDFPRTIRVQGPWKSISKPSHYTAMVFYGWVWKIQFYTHSKLCKAMIQWQCRAHSKHRNLVPRVRPGDRHPCAERPPGASLSSPGPPAPFPSTPGSLQAAPRGKPPPARELESFPPMSAPHFRPGLELEIRFKRESHGPGPYAQLQAAYFPLLCLQAGS